MVSMDNFFGLNNLIYLEELPFKKHPGWLFGGLSPEPSISGDEYSGIDEYPGIDFDLHSILDSTFSDGNSSIYIQLCTNKLKIILFCLVFDSIIDSDESAMTASVPSTPSLYDPDWIYEELQPTVGSSWKRRMTRQEVRDYIQAKEMRRRIRKINKRMAREARRQDLQDSVMGCSAYLRYYGRKFTVGLRVKTRFFYRFLGNNDKVGPKLK